MPKTKASELFAGSRKDKEGELNTSSSYIPRRQRPAAPGGVALFMNESGIGACRQLEVCGPMVGSQREEERS